MRRAFSTGHHAYERAVQLQELLLGPELVGPEHFPRRSTCHILGMLCYEQHGSQMPHGCGSGAAVPVR